MGLAHRYSTDGEHKIKKRKWTEKKKERKDICIVKKKKRKGRQGSPSREHKTLK